MNTIEATTTSTIQLGHQGEKGVLRVKFDLLLYVQQYGEGTVQLLVKRAGEKEVYPAAVERVGTDAYWTIDAEWTAKAGVGYCELNWYVGDTLAKSDIYRTAVQVSLEEPTGEVPEAGASWREQMTEAIEGKLDDTSDHCEMGWRSYAGGHLTEAGNTSFAHGCAVEAAGKAAVGFGYGLVTDYYETVSLLFDAGLDDDCIIVDLDYPKVGDYINISYPGCTISDTKRVVEELPAETGYVYRLNAPFRAENYDESDVLNGVIPAGAIVRKIVPNVASGDSSFVAGRGVKATSEASAAFGKQTTASGECAVAEGKNTVAAGKNSHASGSNTKANGNNSTAEGDNCKTYASATHAGGYMCEAGAEDGSAGTTAFAHGHTCKAKANNSAAIGYFTIAGSTNQLAQGRYNVEDKANKYVHIVGGGSSESKRKNIHTLDWSGNAVFAGGVTAKGVDILAKLVELEERIAALGG